MNASKQGGRKEEETQGRSPQPAQPAAQPTAGAGRRRADLSPARPHARIHPRTPNPIPEAEPERTAISSPASPRSEGPRITSRVAPHRASEARCDLGVAVGVGVDPFPWPSSPIFRGRVKERCALREQCVGGDRPSPPPGCLRRILPLLHDARHAPSCLTDWCEFDFLPARRAIGGERSRSCSTKAIAKGRRQAQTHVARREQGRRGPRRVTSLPSLFLSRPTRSFARSVVPLRKRGPYEAESSARRW